MSTTKHTLSAKARLIAAVPELLEALKEVLASLSNVWEDADGELTSYYTEIPAQIKQARAAIAKAEGSAVDSVGYCDNCSSETSLTEHTCIGDRDCMDILSLEDFKTQIENKDKLCTNN